MAKTTPQTIRITSDVYQALGERAEPFDTPNDVLRRLLGLGEPSRSQSATTRSPMSILDAAAKALQEEGRAMTAEELCAAMRAKNYWKGSGSTPAASVSSALYVDMKLNGTASRFAKEGRGKFIRNKDLMNRFSNNSG